MSEEWNDRGDIQLQDIRRVTFQSESRLGQRIWVSEEVNWLDWPCLPFIGQLMDLVLVESKSFPNCTDCTLVVY